MRVVRQMTTTGRVTASPDPPSRRRDFGHWASVQPGCVLDLLHVYYAAIGPASVHRYVVPSTQIRCRITASLRARATFARFEPRRLATSIPQRLSFENRVMRDNRTLAASYNTVRTISSPASVIPPVTSFSPDWYFFGVSPNSAPAAFDFTIRWGSSIADLHVTATNGPTPRTVRSRRHTASPRTISSTALCSLPYSAFKADRAESIAVAIRSNVA